MMDGRVKAAQLSCIAAWLDWVASGCRTFIHERREVRRVARVAAVPRHMVPASVVQDEQHHMRRAPMFCVRKAAKRCNKSTGGERRRHAVKASALRHDQALPTAGCTLALDDLSHGARAAAGY